MSVTEVQDAAEQEYKWGFVTDIEARRLPPGLNEDIVRLISAKKQEPRVAAGLRLKRLSHWRALREPTWANVRYPPMDFTTRSTIRRPGAAPSTTAGTRWTRS